MGKKVNHKRTGDLRESKTPYAGVTCQLCGRQCRGARGLQSHLCACMKWTTAGSDLIRQTASGQSGSRDWDRPGNGKMGSVREGDGLATASSQGRRKSCNTNRTRLRGSLKVILYQRGSLRNRVIPNQQGSKEIGPVALLLVRVPHQAKRL